MFFEYQPSAHQKYLSMLDKLMIALLIAGISNAQTTRRTPSQLMDLSIHILDGTRGLPAVNCRVRL